jgi:hypothetical protein
MKINRIKYANMYGPTTGDKVRLGDTGLFIEIEKDFTVMVMKQNLVVAKLSGMAWRNQQPPPVMKACWILLSPALSL